MKKKMIAIVVIAFITVTSLTGCSNAGLDSGISELKGSIKGNTYHIGFYSNTSENFMNMSGKKD